MHIGKGGTLEMLFGKTSTIVLSVWGQPIICVWVKPPSCVCVCLLRALKGYSAKKITCLYTASNSLD